jgi:hypothetical protein
VTDYLWELERVPWSTLRSGSPRGTAADVPRLLRTLAETEDLEARKGLRAALEEEIMHPSMFLFEVAPYVVPFLLAILVHSPHVGSRATALVLLNEVSHGQAHHSELEAGNENLVARVKQELGEGRAVFYSLVNSDHFPFRSMTVNLLAALDGATPRFLHALDWLERNRPDPSTAEVIADARDVLADR